MGFNVDCSPYHASSAYSKVAHFWPWFQSAALKSLWRREALLMATRPETLVEVLIRMHFCLVCLNQKWKWRGFCLPSPLLLKSIKVNYNAYTAAQIPQYLHFFLNVKQSHRATTVDFFSKSNSMTEIYTKDVMINWPCADHLILDNKVHL